MRSRACALARRAAWHAASGPRPCGASHSTSACACGLQPEPGLGAGRPHPPAIARPSCAPRSTIPRPPAGRQAPARRPRWRAPSPPTRAPTQTATASCTQRPTSCLSSSTARPCWSVSRTAKQHPAPCVDPPGARPAPACTCVRTCTASPRSGEAPEPASCARVPAGEAVAKKRRVPSAKGFDYYVEAAFTELHSEECRDLLSKGAGAAASLPVRGRRGGEGPAAPGHPLRARAIAAACHRRCRASAQ